MEFFYAKSLRLKMSLPRVFEIKIKQIIVLIVTQIIAGIGVVVANSLASRLDWLPKVILPKNGIKSRLDNGINLKMFAL